ncbi:cathepsin L-like peptidase [Parasteatoda tepidariorum]|uniref:cathepsin L-like peptidase n=1 Tax=Parasteatoda tepidariorum TaxID=114398 RepID=UPI000A2C0127|nr:procathepsin L [Parasteatoda tepidariorum]
MKFFILLTSCIATAMCLSFPFKAELNEHWNLYKELFGKTYVGLEEVQRRLIWEERIADIVKHNLRADLGIHSFTRGVNKYSDLSHEEYMQSLNGFKVSDEGHHKNVSEWIPLKDADVPAEVDWRKEGLVTKVKDQEDCGACWAFSSTGALEGQNMRKTGKLASLSEQNLIDCVKENDGCGGGFMDPAFEYVKGNQGIDTEESYEYKNKVGSCIFKKEYIGATCTGHVDIPTGDEEALRQAVATVGPISVGINAHHEEFHTYRSGIYDQPDCKNKLYDLTHAVLVVGYGSENGVDYWLVKNSWGLSYGMNGYIKMSRNKDNQCGIATFASYPLV